jgi:hypothetical protein
VPREATPRAACPVDASNPVAATIVSCEVVSAYNRLLLSAGATKPLEMPQTSRGSLVPNAQAQSRSAALQNMSGTPTGAQARSGHRRMSS